MVVADYRYKVIYMSTGSYGREGDAGVFGRSDFGEAIKDHQNNPLKLPPPAALPGTNVVMPHFFLGDSAFPLLKHMMKPFHNRD
ncbi:nuclease HARBI1-like protein [Aphelenchoides avenae]|nr:nuclease HARBI1-like protein [Aphelenchus avenae]